MVDKYETAPGVKWGSLAMMTLAATIWMTWLVVFVWVVWHMLSWVLGQ